MKRIALIRNSYSYDVGGGELFPINLGKILQNSGYEALLFSANSRTLQIAADSHLKTVRSPWWSFQNFSGFRIMLTPVYAIWILILTIWYVAAFHKHRIDVAYPQSRDDFIAATFAAKLLRKVVVWSDHADLKHIYRNHRYWYKNPVGKLVYFTSKLADHVVVESDSERRLIEEQLGGHMPQHYTVIYPGAVDTFKPKRATRSDAYCVFVSTSRLVSAKGIKELILAFQLLDMPETRLQICGDGPDAENFKSLAKESDAIEFLGHVHDVPKVLQGADVFVHPTYHEGFGLSLVEAEMCALPIIASNVGSIPEIVENGTNGILVPSQNYKELANAMKQLAGNPQLRQSMGEKSRKIFLDSFQFDHIVREKIIPLFNR